MTISHAVIGVLIDEGVVGDLRIKESVKIDIDYLR